MNPDARSRPLGLVPSLLAFGIPAGMMWGLVWHVLPSLHAKGVSLMALFGLSATPLVAMLVATGILYQAEGNPWTWAAFRDRVGLASLDRRVVGWSLALTIGGMGLYLGAAVLVDKLFPSAAFPAVFEKILGDKQTFLGHPLKGGWWLLGVWFLFYLANVLGEELWFRGMVLPRQIAAFGPRAWLVHGLLWAGWHGGFFPTDALVILPEALAYGWVCQRTRSTWPGLVAHGVLNGMVALRLVGGILG